MEVNNLQKYNLANKISNIRIKNIAPYVLEQAKNSSVNFISHDLTKCEYDNYQIVLIDFEGSPLFMCGLLIHGKILTFYIDSYQLRNELYITIFELLKIIKNYTLYAFSDHERFELRNMYRYLQVQGKETSQYSFIETFPIVNLQQTQYESLAEAIFSLRINTTSSTAGDPLLRNSKLVNSLFMHHQLQEIILHNRNCLINAYTLFQKRWLKNYKI